MIDRLLVKQFLFCRVWVVFLSELLELLLDCLELELSYLFDVIKLKSPQQGHNFILQVWRQVLPGICQPEAGLVGTHCLDVGLKV
jgi:hypothetical protein